MSSRECKNYCIGIDLTKSSESVFSVFKPLSLSPYLVHLPGEGGLEGGAVPAPGPELELALVDGAGSALADRVHEAGVLLAEVDLEGGNRKVRTIGRGSYN